MLECAVVLWVRSRLKSLSTSFPTTPCPRKEIDLSRVWDFGRWTKDVVVRKLDYIEKVMADVGITLRLRYCGKQHLRIVNPCPAGEIRFIRLGQVKRRPVADSCYSIKSMKQFHFFTFKIIYGHINSDSFSEICSHVYMYTYIHRGYIWHCSKLSSCQMELLASYSNDKYQTSLKWDGSSHPVAPECRVSHTLRLKYIEGTFEDPFGSSVKLVHSRQHLPANKEYCRMFRI